MSNITEPQRSEEVRRQIEDRFRRLVEVTPVAVYVCDTTGIIQSYNKRAVELWGREPRDQGTRLSVIAAHCVAARAARASGRAGWRKPRHPCGRQRRYLVDDRESATAAVIIASTRAPPALAADANAVW